MLTFTARVSLAFCLLLASAISAQAERKAPIVDTLSRVSSNGTQTITLTGSHFGTQPPYTGNSDFIAVKVCPQHMDMSRCRGGWEAGYEPNNDLVGLIVESWTDTKIVIGGFTNYGSGRHKLETGEVVTFQLWNFPILKTSKKSKCSVIVDFFAEDDCH